MIAEAFARVRARDELALMPYVTLGYPSLAASLEHLQQIESSGADLIEIGMPFSDPVADGPTIQHASQVALDAGVRLADALDAVGRGHHDVPLILMSYLNPLLALGREQVFERLREARVAGLIVPDLPPEEARPWLETARAHGLSLVPLVAPTSPAARVRRILELSDGFLYYVSLTGTTGARAELGRDLLPGLARLRRLTSRPLAVGFGISRPEHVRQLRGHCDGVVVGSRIVEAIRQGGDLPDLIRQLKRATRRESC